MDLSGIFTVVPGLAEINRIEIYLFNLNVRYRNLISRPFKIQYGYTILQADRTP